MKTKAILVVMMIIMSVSSLAWAVPIETREYFFGDVDNFHNDGSGSVDDVYIDPTWLSWVETSAAVPVYGFDIISADHQIPFTFQYELANKESITSATLTVGVKAPGAPATTDMIWLDHQDRSYSFENLGWLPISTNQLSVRSLDLANVTGDNLLQSLQDGQLNVLIRDDTCIDYAQLTLTIIPEPSTLLLLSLGGLFLRKRK